MLLPLLQFFATKFLVLALHLETGSFPRPLTAREELAAFAASRWRTFWTTTPCFSTGAVETSSADTGRQKAGTVSSLPTMPR